MSNLRERLIAQMEKEGDWGLRVAHPNTIAFQAFRPEDGDFDTFMVKATQMIVEIRTPNQPTTATEE